MGAAIGEIIPTAVGVAISPIPIVAVILMLFTPRARSNGVAFVAGWVIGLSGAGLIVLAIGLEASDGGPSTTAGVIKLALGVLFLALAWRNWSSRPREGEQPEAPGWMAAIDDFTVPKALGLAVLLSALNPKNLALTIAAAASISGAGLSTSEEIVVLAIFVALASVTVALPVVIYLILGSRGANLLDELKDWLVANNDTVMAVLLLVFGAKLIGDAIQILS